MICSISSYRLSIFGPYDPNPVFASIGPVVILLSANLKVDSRPGLPSGLQSLELPRTSETAQSSLTAEGELDLAGITSSNLASY